MNIELTIQPIEQLVSDALVVGAVRTTSAEEIHLTKTAATVDTILHNLISERCKAGEFSAALGELLTIHTQGNLAVPRVLVVGLGAQQSLTPHKIQRASATAARHLQETGAHSLALALDPEQEQLSPSAQIQAQVEGALLGLYTFRMYRHNVHNGKSVSQIQVVATEQQQNDLHQALTRATAFAEAANFARTLVNEPPNVLTPPELANRARVLAQETGLQCEVFDKAKITELGMGGLLAVSQGSALPPQFVILRYRGAPGSDKTLALVGKGITFDTGGISIKPAEHMDEMKGDMGGAAAVLGAMHAIAHLKPNINVTALIPTCENMPSGTAYRPGDIIRISNGKTFEIVNTDAEGRLILADALSYAVKENLSPIIDVATLTGGIVVALGSVMTGLFSNDQALTDQILSASQTTGEKYWLMPLDDDYKELVHSEIADIKQSAGRWASSVSAAKILEQFVAATPWAHLDIAGTSYLDSKRPYAEKGGTGVAARTLAELALQLAQKM